MKCFHRKILVYLDNLKHLLKYNFNSMEFDLKKILLRKYKHVNWQMNILAYLMSVQIGFEIHKKNLFTKKRKELNFIIQF